MSVFHFKYFTVKQVRSALKVGTDALLLGALCDVNKAKEILDLGCGTGVLSLMMAQKNHQARITAIDIQTEAVQETEENVLSSAFNNDFNCIQVDFLTWSPQLLFDAIVANPPFFMDSYLSNKQAKNIARHTDTLPLQKWLEKSKKLLTNEGSIQFIFPFESEQYCEQLFKGLSLNIKHKVVIYGKPAKKVRLFYELTLHHTATLETEFTIRTLEGNYTPEYIELTKEFHAKDLSKKV